MVDVPPVPSRRPSLEDLLSAQAQEQAKAEAERSQAERLRQERLAAESQAQREQQAFEQSAPGQAYEIGKIAAPLGVGALYGHHEAGKIEGREQQMDPAKRRSMGAGRRFLPYAAKAGTYMLPEAVALRVAATQMDEGTQRDLVNAASLGLSAAGGIHLGEGAVRSLTPPRVEGEAETPDTPSRQRAQTPASDAPAGTQPRTHSERLKAAVRSAGGPNVRTKAEARDWLEKNLDEGKRAAIGRELGVAPGRNFTGRLRTAIKSMASRPGLWAPLGAGALAYDAARSDARAGGEEVDATTGAGEAAAAAGGTAAGIYGLGKAGELAMRYAPWLSRVAGPVGAATGAGLTAYDAYNAFQNNPPEPGPKYPTTSDIRGAHRRQMPRAPLGIGP